MVAPHKKALKNASLTFTPDGSCKVTLGGICRELTKISGENVLEFLSIHVEISDESDIEIGDGWRMLDKVLTSSGWPALKIFLLEIDLLLYNISDDRVRTLKKRTKSQFPRLSRSKSLDFRLQFT